MSGTQLVYAIKLQNLTAKMIMDGEFMLRMVKELID